MKPFGRIEKGPERRRETKEWKISKSQSNKIKRQFKNVFYAASCRVTIASGERSKYISFPKRII